MSLSLIDILLKIFSNEANIPHNIEEKEEDETELFIGSFKQKYSVGDVIKVRLFKGKTCLKIQEKITRLARIRIINIPKEYSDKLRVANNNHNDKSHFIGVEYFNWKFHPKQGDFHNGFIDGTNN